jgi:nitrite reductase/ring-hydroxylating ferredoxin subunit
VRFLEIFKLNSLLFENHPRNLGFHCEVVDRCRSITGMDENIVKPQLDENRGNGTFASLPASWFHLCASNELTRGPVSIELCGHSYVGYRTQSGRAAVLSGRCSHMGAHLGQGTISGERLVCPLHGWEYGPGGACERIPASETIPDFARQCSYPAEERGGHIFFFNRQQARFALPFFDGLTPDQLLPAKPFELVAEVPWYFIGANGFDLQHFRMAHDRTLLEQPEVSSPSPFARRVVAKFSVSGNSYQDQLTRLIAGPRVTMDVTVWCGTLILVRAEFQRTTSFGIFNVLPIDAKRTRGRVIVWVKRSQTAFGRGLFDALNAAIRRLFIQTFLRSDLTRIAGLRYQPGNLIAADGVLSDYFAWLEKVAKPSPTKNL